MRILTLAPIIGGGTSIAEDIRDAISALNFEHKSLNQPSWINAYQRSRKEQNPLSFYAKVNKALEQALDSFNPNFVLTFALCPIPPGFGAKLKARGVKSAHWFFEDGKRFPNYERMAREHDVLFAIQRSVVRTLQAKGHLSSSYLPLGVPPRCSSPTLYRSQSPEHAIAFVGTPSSWRRELFTTIAAQGVKLWGPGWQQLGEPLASAAQADGRWLTREEEIDIYLNSQLVVNLHQDAGPKGGPDFVNPRTFLLAGLGVPQLLEDRLELAPLFDLTNELTTFKSTTNLATQVSQLLEATDHLERKAQRAKNRALTNHRLENRIIQIIEKVAELKK